jgi:hypothetical protein
MTHPPNVCAHCENGRDPVTLNNGFIFAFQIVDGVIMEVCLHEGCMDPWCQAFNVRPQGLSFGASRLKRPFQQTGFRKYHISDQQSAS